MPRALIATLISIHHAFMSIQTVYVLSSLLLLALLVHKLRAISSFSMRIPTILAICLVIAVPIVFRYSPPIEASQGNEMRWITAPGLIEGVSKRCERSIDASVRYNLLGWTNKTELIFEKHVHIGFSPTPEYWAYLPETGDLLQVPMPDQETLSRTSANAHTQLETAPYWNARRGDDQYTARLEYQDPFSWMLPEGALASPDGRWIAVRTRHVISGPEDVLVIRDIDQTTEDET